MRVDRRMFVRCCSALAAFLGEEKQSRISAAPQGRQTGVKHRKNYVGIQVKPYAWVDEGIDHVLDNLQKGAVNTVWAYTYDYSEARMKPNGPIPLPDHGKAGEPNFVGGAFYDYDPKYFRSTVLKDFRSPDYGKFNVISDVAPKVKARGMDFFCWDYNNAFPIMNRSMPNLSQVTEIDIYGRRTSGACFNHPDYRAHLRGKIESCLSGYPSEVDGIAWGCERMGPLQNAIGGTWSTRGLTCFCEFCQAKARGLGISVDRARKGYLQLDDFLAAAAADRSLTDGYFVTFWRMLLDYPEILSWEKLWTDSYHEVRAELYGVGKAIAPEKPFGFHIMQNMTFSPFYRAEEDYSKTKEYADYLKLATYNNAGGPRMAAYLDRLSATIFHDAKPQDFTEFYYKIMKYREQPYDKLPKSGLSADYVARETERAITGVNKEIKIYPGIDIDVPDKLTDKRTSPDDVRQAIRAAFGAGADGVILSREYVEMWMANLTAAGDTLKEIFANQRAAATKSFETQIKPVGVLAILLVFLLLPRGLYAQAVANATIHGVVTDGTGAAVANAQVKATQTATGQIQSTNTVTDGSYTLPNLPVGPYRLVISAPSFKNYAQSGITLQVGNDVQINAILQLGTVNQTIEVAANAAMVETQNTSISEVIDEKRIIELPLNGRQATDLILLAGGAAVPPGAAGRFLTTHDYASSTAVSVSGGQENGNNYLLDGGDHNDTHSNVNLPFPFPDALQEFSVQTDGVSARYGLHPYAVVNAITKSGTNQIHGDVFEFVRNGALNARNFFAATQDSLRRNQFGGTIGAPIRKDKLFIFGGYQATRVRTAPPQTISFVPTQAALNGDFSTLESAACQSSHRAVTLINPSNGTPFPNNFVNPAQFSLPAVRLAKLIPVATNPCGQINYGIPNPNNENQAVSRVDWLQSPKNTVYGRFFVADYDNPPYYTDNILTTTRSGLAERATSAVVADQYATATLVNSFHATYNRLINNRTISGQTPSLAALGSNMYNPNPNFIDLIVSGKFTVGGGSNAPATFARNTFQYADDVDLIRGRHHVIFGVDYIAMQMDEININLANGVANFNGTATNDALADFLLGVANNVQQGSPFQIGLRQKYWGVYGQDDVRLGRGVTVHLGLRWEPSLPEHDILNRGSHFSLPAFLAGQKSSVYSNSPAGLLFHGDSGIPPSYANGSWIGFAPRVGLAWDPSGRGTQSIRTAYGVFFDEPETFTARDFGASAPWGNAISLTQPAGGLNNPYQTYPGGNPFPLPYPPAKNAVFPAAGQYVNFPLNLHHMYQQQWNFSYQRQLTGNWLISASYMGSKATHLRASTEENPAVYLGASSTVANTQARRTLTLLNPAQGAFYSNITLADDGINTNYNALRLSAQHRFSQGFTLLSVYTWSHCMQDAETYGNRNSLGSTNYQNPYNRNLDHAPCDTDLRHNFNNSLVYETPRLKNSLADQLIGHWQVGAILTVHTGFPFTPLTGIDNSRTGVGLDRPNVVGDPYVRNTTSLVWISPTALVANPIGTFGNAGYNSLRAAGFFDIDANVSRFFQIQEHKTFELRFEFFNVLNHTNFNPPVASLNSASFGVIQSSGDPRILQLAAKFRF